jgi:TolB protein
MSTDPLLAALTLRLAAASGPSIPEPIPCGPPIGIFEGTTDIGSGEPGSTLLKPHTGTYYLTGGGADLGGAEDGFHFAWRRFFGNGCITADVQFLPTPRPAREKAVLIFRQSFDPGSPYAAVVMHGDGRILLQYRQSKGSVTFRIAGCQHHATTLSIERFGGLFAATASSPVAPFRPVARIVLPLREPLYAGLGVCTEDPETLATVAFSKVRIG